MSPAPDLAGVTDWRRFLLEDPLHPQLAEDLPAFLKAEGHAFLERAKPFLDLAEDVQLERWYGSSEGQEALSSVTRALWAQMSEFSAHAMPAHDARHAMFKVPAAALEYMTTEKVQGWERIGLLGALLHDHGRWAEERIWGYPGESLVHARLSFLLGRQVLESFDMPQAARDQILLAAIRHTSGAVPRDPMPLKLTVSADRDQLYGPEVILRLLHHAAGTDGDMASFYGEVEGRTVLDRLYVFLTNRLPGPLFSRAEHVEGLWQVLADFILLCEDEDESRRRFCAGRKLPPEGFVWRDAWERAQQRLLPEVDPVTMADALLCAPHVAPAAHYRHSALCKVAMARKDRWPALGSALALACHARFAEDRRQLLHLHDIQSANRGDAFVHTLCTLLIANWGQPSLAPAVPPLP